MSKPETLRFCGNNRFQIGFIFAGIWSISIYYFNTKLYMNFCIILTHFYINFSKQEHSIDVLNMYRSTPDILRFNPILWRRSGGRRGSGGVSNRVSRRGKLSSFPATSHIYLLLFLRFDKFSFLNLVIKYLFKPQVYPSERS